MNVALYRLKTEPSLVISIISAVLALVVAWGVNLSSEQTGGIIAVVVAALAIEKARAVKPFFWPIVSGLVQAVLALLLTFGVHMSDEKVGTIMAVVTLVLGTLVRQAVTPETKLQPVYVRAA